LDENRGEIVFGVVFGTEEIDKEIVELDSFNGFLEEMIL
jgi:hypothetical protein